MHLFNFAICFFDYLIAYEFLENFLEEKTQGAATKWVTIVMLSGILFSVNLLGYTWLNPIVFCFTVIAISLQLFAGSFSTKTSLSLFFSVLPIVTEFLSTFVFSLILKDSVLSILEFPHNKVIAKTIATLTLWAIVKAIKLFYEKSRYNVSNFKSNGLLILPISSIIIMYSVLHFEKWVPSTTENAFLTSSICILLGLVNLIVFNVYDDQVKSIQLKGQLINAKISQEKTEEYYRAQEQHLQEMYALAHDFKNHLVVIRAMSNSDKSVNDYLDQLSGKLTNNTKGIIDYTTNKAINVIIYQKQQICLEYNISMTIKISYPILDFIKYSDACAIFGNALDNAISACVLQVKTEKYISINVFKHNDTLVIEFLNSKNPSVKISCDNKSIFKTTKKQTQLHGYGLINITESVKAYDGRALFNYTEDTFTVTILMSIPKNKK